MRFDILGPMEVCDGRTRLTPQAAKIRTLLACLLVSANTAVGTDTLVTEIWGTNPPRTALHALRVYVFNIRQMIAAMSDDPDRPAVVTWPSGYSLELAPDMLDMLEFDRLCDEALRASAKQCYETATEKYRRALALWRGPALLDVSSGVLLNSAARRLEERRIAAVKARIDIDLRLRRHGDVVPELTELAARHPFNEGLHVRLMVALHGSGRTGDALTVYRGLRDSLVAELGVEPNPQLQRVHLAMLTADQQVLDRQELWAL